MFFVALSVLIATIVTTNVNSDAEERVAVQKGEFTNY